MKKITGKHFTGLIVLILILISILFFVPGQEDKIKSEIEKANYCEVKSDCVQIDSKCPFGCYVFVNEKEAKKVQSLIDDYDSTCIYSCIQLKDYDCIENKCVVEVDSL